MNENAQGFRASLFHPDFGNEAVEGRIFIDRQRLRFESESVTQEIPADRLEVDWDESDGRVYINDPENPDLKIYTLEQAVLKLAFLPQMAELRERVDSIQGRRDFSRRLRVTAYFIGICVVIAWGFSFAMGVMVRSIAARVPPEWERKLGEDALKEMDVENSSATYSNQVKQLAALAAPLLQALPKGGADVRFYIADEPQPNAFALPGGFVVVSSGLLELAERPEEIQGVLAHELAHVTQKHLVRKL
ncbi:MAG TPA: M48 family metalloprotease, partial [Candidatus Paceibacterota bacterium]|nr:M48 family metalloprotease [Candidatus Paceibacterota bacterium]